MNRISLILLALVACGDDDSVVFDDRVESDIGGEADEGVTAPQTCADVDRSAVGTTLENVSADLTLSGVVNVPAGRITHTGGTLRFEAGTIVLLAPGAHIKFGFGGAVGSVIMAGTEAEPVLFCGTAANPGTYGNLDFGPALLGDSALRNVRFEDGGDADGPGNPLSNGPSSALRFAGETGIELVNVVVRNGQGIGINASSFGAASRELTVSEMTGRPLHLRTANAVNNLPSGSYTGNGEDLIEVAGVQNRAAEITFGARGVPYIQVVERVNFGEEGHVVTFEAGVEYRFSPGAFMVVGFGNSVGTLLVNGTTEAPVIFTSGADAPEPGDWNGLQLGPQIQSTSVINNAEFRFGGQAPDGACREDDANLSFAGANDTDVAVTNVRFADSAGFGVCVIDGRQLVNGETDVTTGLTGSGNVFEGNAAGEVGVARPRN
ncbi:MAG: hypothetical protein AAF938_10440 [Myxococcota bacterium]